MWLETLLLIAGGVVLMLPGAYIDPIGSAVVGNPSFLASGISPIYDVQEVAEKPYFRRDQKGARCKAHAKPRAEAYIGSTLERGGVDGDHLNRMPSACCGRWPFFNILLDLSQEVRPDSGNLPMTL
jgi:hypothetical protein